MKSIHLKLIALLLPSALMVSCKKNDSPTETPAPAPVAATGGFTFKLDGGATITVDSANAILYSLSTGRQIDVYAYKGGTEILEFHFDPSTGLKPAGSTLGTNALLTYMASPILSYDSQSGSINITKCDTVANKIEGDFNFIGKQYPYTGSVEKTITEGHMIVSKLAKQ